MLRKLIKVSGIIVMFYIVINFYFFVFVAMANEGIVVVYFDKLGEATIEYIIYILLMPLITVSFVLEVQGYVKEREKYRKEKGDYYTKR